MRHIPFSLSNVLMTRSGFEPYFLRVDRCCEISLGFVAHGGGLGIRFWVCSRKSVKLVEFGSVGVQVKSVQYVGRLVVKD